jgi:hypothetical protein
MRRTSLNCFLILLLLSAMSDDAWALNAVETDVEELVTQNNVYLHSACHSPHQRPEMGGLPCAAHAVDLRHLSTTGPASDMPAGRRFDTFSGPDLLHLLMTLRR